MNEAEAMLLDVELVGHEPAIAQHHPVRFRLAAAEPAIDAAGRAPSILHVRGLPTTLLIDPNGMEIGRIEGDADWDDPDTLAFLKKLMQPGAVVAKQQK